MFRYQLLGLLRDGERRHGYALIKEYNRRTGLEVKPGYGYRELQKLVNEHLVEPATNPLGADPRRIPYTITLLGRAAFDEWFADVPRANLGSDGELAARAIFFSEVDPEAAVGVLAAYRRDLWYLSKTLERAIEIPRAKEVDGSAYPVLLKRRKRAAALEIEFLEDLRIAFRLPGTKQDNEAAEPEVTAKPREPEEPAKPRAKRAARARG